jgi:hypothetical protein
LKCWSQGPFADLTLELLSEQRLEPLALVLGLLTSIVPTLPLLIWGGPCQLQWRRSFPMVSLEKIEDIRVPAKYLILLVGARGFEPPTPSLPD